MFKPPWVAARTFENQMVARRLSRIAFGAVLIAGAVALVPAAMAGHGDTPRVIVVTWIAAAVAGWLARAHVPADPNHDALGVASLVVPIVGLFLIGPLTLHLPFALLLRTGVGTGFDHWVAMSFCLVGLAHLAGALSGAVRATQLARGKPAWSPSRVFLITIIASLLPGAVLVVPPFLVAVTGLPFLLVLHAMEPIARRERVALETSAKLPLAIARSA